MQKFIEFARAILINKPNNVKHVSFITYKKTIVCYGINNPFKTEPLASRYGYRFNCIHSEVSAIKSFPYKPSKLKIYTMINVRILANGKVGLSKPCRICQKLLRDFGIRKVLYTNKLGQFEKFRRE